MSAEGYRGQPCKAPDVKIGGPLLMGPPSALEGGITGLVDKGKDANTLDRAATGGITGPDEKLEARNALGGAGEGDPVRPEKFQFLEKWLNSNFGC